MNRRAIRPLRANEARGGQIHPSDWPRAIEVGERERCALKVIDRVIIELPDHLRSPFVLYFIQRKSLLSVALALERDPREVLDRLERARARIDRALMVMRIIEHPLRNGFWDVLGESEPVSPGFVSSTMEDVAETVADVEVRLSEDGRTLRRPLRFWQRSPLRFFVRWLLCFCILTLVFFGFRRGCSSIWLGSLSVPWRLCQGSSFFSIPSGNVNLSRNPKHLPNFCFPACIF